MSTLGYEPVPADLGGAIPRTPDGTNGHLCERSLLAGGGALHAEPAGSKPRGATVTNGGYGGGGPIDVTAQGASAAVPAAEAKPFSGSMDDGRAVAVLAAGQGRSACVDRRPVSRARMAKKGSVQRNEPRKGGGNVYLATNSSIPGGGAWDARREYG